MRFGFRRRTIVLFAFVAVLSLPVSADEEWWGYVPPCYNIASANFHVAYGSYQSIFWVRINGYTHPARYDHECTDPDGCTETESAQILTPDPNTAFEGHEIVDSGDCCTAYHISIWCE